MAHPHIHDGVGTAPPGQAPDKVDPLQAFRLIDAKLDRDTHREQLTALRRRLAGELLGAAELVEATLAADFELVTHAQGRTTALNRDAVIASARGQGTAVIWVELADLAVEHGVVGGHGVLRTMAGSLLTTAPLAFFTRFDGRLMTSEVLYLDVASETPVPPEAGVPSRERMRDLLGLDHAEGQRWS
jgi:hypothetical protein